MKIRSKLILGSLVAPALAVSLAACGQTPGGGSNGAAEATANAQTSAAPSPLEKVASDSEDLMDAAILADANKEQAALDTLKSDWASLSAEQQNQWNAQVQKIEADIKAGEHTAAGLAAAELYKGLVEAQDWSGKPVPKEVALLDYDGFRAEIIASASSPDWSALKSVATEAQTRLDGLSIGDENLADVTGGIATTLAYAADNQVQPLAKSAAKQMLAVVDLLEGYYEKQ